MELSNRFVANLAGWRLTRAVDSGSSASPLLQASLAFPAVAGPRIGSAGRGDVDGPAVERWLASGLLQLRLGSPARAILTGSVSGADAGYCTVEATLPREQFEWLLALVDQPHCDVQLEFELPTLPLAVDALGRAGAELVNPRYWVTTTCGAGTLGAEALTARLDADRSAQLGISALPAGAPLARMDEQTAPPTTMQPSLSSDSGSGHDLQQGRLLDAEATAGPAAADEPATMPQEDEDTAAQVPPLAAGPTAQPQTTPAMETGETGADGPLRASAAPASTTTAPTETLAVDRPSDVQHIVSALPTDESGPALRASRVDDLGVVGTMTSSALPAPDLDVVTPALESPPEPAAVADSAPIEAEGQSLKALSSLDTQPGLRGEVPAQDQAPIGTSMSTVAAAPVQAVAPPTSPGVTDHAASTLSPTTSTLPADPPSASSGARLLRPVLGLAFIALLAIAIGGHWFAGRSVESNAAPDVAAAVPAPIAAAPPPAMSSSPASTVVTPAAPVTLVATNKMDEPPAATVEATTQKFSNGSQSQAVAAVADEPASSTPSVPERAAAEATPPATAKPLATARRSAPRAVAHAHNAGRNAARDRAAKAAKTSEAANATAPPPVAPVAVAAPPIATPAPVPPPIQKAQPEPALPATPPDPCSSLVGLKLAQCRSCARLGTARRYVCERSVNVSYCAGKWGETPDCPWQSTAGEDSNYALKP